MVAWLVWLVGWVIYLFDCLVWLVWLVWLVGLVGLLYFFVGGLSVGCKLVARFVGCLGAGIL